MANNEVRPSTKYVKNIPWNIEQSKKESRKEKTWNVYHLVTVQCVM